MHTSNFSEVDLHFFLNILHSLGKYLILSAYALTGKCLSSEQLSFSGGHELFFQRMLTFLTHVRPSKVYAHLLLAACTYYRINKSNVRLVIIASGHTASNAPDLFRTPKLSGAGPG